MLMSHKISQATGLLVKKPSSTHRIATMMDSLELTLLVTLVFDDSNQQHNFWHLYSAGRVDIKLEVTVRAQSARRGGSNKFVCFGLQSQNKLKNLLGTLQRKHALVKNN